MRGVGDTWCVGRWTNARKSLLFPLGEMTGTSGGAVPCPFAACAEPVSWVVVVGSTHAVIEKPSVRFSQGEDGTWMRFAELPVVPLKRIDPETLPVDDVWMFFRLPSAPLPLRSRITVPDDRVAMS